MVRIASENSTSVRARIAAAVTAARLVAPALPGVAIGLALHVFTSPRRHEAPARERELEAKGESLRLGGGRIAARRFGEGAPVVLMHGWEGRGLQLGAFVTPLVERGFSVIAPDAPGHGDSAGARATLRDFADTLHAVQERVGPLAGLVAHSFGGAAATLAMTEGLRVEAAVFVGSPSSMTARVREFLALVGLPEALAPLLEDRVGEVVGKHPRDVEVRTMGAEIATPLLVVHDEEDREVSFACATDYLEAFPDARLVATRGLGHRRILRDPDVVARAADFVAARAGAGRRSAVDPWLDAALGDRVLFEVA
ncbi:MAG: alpha/beta fold hydrolase [Polyangiales bacterium]